MNRRLWIALAGAGIAQAAWPQPAPAMRIVSPFPPGGANAIIARLLAKKLQERTGRAVLVENKPGAAGAIGTRMVAAAAPDGNTLVLGTLATHGINTSVYKDLQYDAQRDFAPIALVASIPIVVVANPSVPVNDIAGLIQLAKQQPGKLHFGASGLGTVNHLAGELFKSTAKVDIPFVPYKGSAPALTDLLGGQIELMFDLLPSALPHIRAGKLKALAVTTATRSALLPDVPTLDESGLRGYAVTSWFGLLAPAGTPPAGVAALNADIAAILQSPDVRELMSRQGAEPYYSTAGEFARVIKTDTETWAALVNQLGLRQ